MLPTEVQQAEPPVELLVVDILRVEPLSVTPPEQYTPSSGRSSEQDVGSSTTKDTTTNSLTQMIRIIKPWVQLSSWIMLLAPVMVGLWP